MSSEAQPPFQIVSGASQSAAWSFQAARSHAIAVGDDPAPFAALLGAEHRAQPWPLSKVPVVFHTAFAVQPNEESGEVEPRSPVGIPAALRFASVLTLVVP